MENAVGSSVKGLKSILLMMGLSIGLLPFCPASAYGLRSIQPQDSPELTKKIAAGMEEEQELPPGPLPVHIGWMIRRHMPEVLAIEQSVEQPVGAPWLEKDFLRTLGQRNAIGMVAEYKGKVVGFMIYELYEKHLQLLNLAVHPDYRNHRVGAALVEKLVSKLSSHRRTRIVMDLPEKHLDSQLFLKKMGFQAIPIGQGLYRFVYSLPETNEPPEELPSGEPEVAGSRTEDQASEQAEGSEA